MDRRKPFTTLTILLISTLLVSPVQAARTFSGDLVPAELLSRLLNVSTGEFYQSLPDDFPLVPFPAGLRLKVNISHDQGVLKKVLLTDLGDSSQTLELLRDAYTSQGWYDLSRESSGQVFFRPAILNLCHDTQGSLTIQPEDNNQLMVTYTNRVNLSPLSGGENCSVSFAMKLAGYTEGLFAIVGEQLPSLNKPEDAEFLSNIGSLVGTRPFYASSSSSSSSSSYRFETTNSITLENSGTAELQSHYAEQLLAAGWEVDASATGSTSAVSTWTRSAVYPQIAGWDKSGVSYELNGVLTLFADGNNYKVEFRMYSER